jgi:hypothetical protein
VSEVDVAESLIVRLVRRIDAAAFRKPDELAKRHGWQIESGRLLQGRTYRHPAFDRLAQRPVAKQPEPAVSSDRRLAARSATRGRG